MKKFVYDQHGFFLVEQLLSLSITSILALAFAALLQMLPHYQVNPNLLSQHEVETLATRLQQEAGLADGLWVENNQLNLMVDGSVISYALSNGRISRRVNGSGGEIALYGASGFFVAAGSNQSAHLSITGHDGVTHGIYLINFTRREMDE
ncbi:MAG: hypothetical protein FWF59_05680 [Turicibacter sp.]|nr:hypothetical protein [Turicibacter sp.]